MRASLGRGFVGESQCGGRKRKRPILIELSHSLDSHLVREHHIISRDLYCSLICMQTHPFKAIETAVKNNSQNICINFYSGIPLEVILKRKWIKKLQKRKFVE